MPNLHLVHSIRNQVERLSGKEALKYKANGTWQSITWREFGAQVDNLSKALLSLGLNVQDKIGILSNNMPQWTIADFAAQQIRCSSVPIYPTSTTEQAAYIINDANVKVLFVGDQEQLAQAIELKKDCPELEKIILMKTGSSTLSDPALLHFETLIDSFKSADSTELDKRLAELQMDDLMTLIYTSGTTGQPKGVMLDYNNIDFQITSHNIRLALTENDVSLSFLPLSHVFERAWTVYVLYRGATNCYVENPTDVREALTEIRPTVMCAVPRFYEKIYSAIHQKVGTAPWVRRTLFNQSVRIGERYSVLKQKGQKPSAPLKFAHKLADKLVLSKLRDLLGGRIRFSPCGGAKLEPSIGKFFHAINVNVKLGYGMTETTASISCWEDGSFNPDSIGPLMPGVQARIGPNDEIEVKGGMVMRGYYNNPKATAETFTEDGYLKTGDAGRFDEQGNIYITDRIKELMKTSNGKYIAPQHIEGKIGTDHMIEQIAVIADARKFVSALIVPCFESLEAHAKELNIIYHDRLDLLKHSQIIQLFEDRLHEVQQGLAKFEQVKKFTLLDNAFSMEKGELTPTMKLRRKVITERYQKLIDRMYHSPQR